jgi:hypothetical protein
MCNEHVKYYYGSAGIERFDPERTQEEARERTASGEQEKADV